MIHSDTERLSNWLRALAEPTRLELFDLIVRGFQCNCQLSDQLDLSANLISHHLGVLREVGLVETERDPTDGRWVYYSVNPETLSELNGALGSFFDPKRIAPRRLTCGPQAPAQESGAVASIVMEPQ